MLSQETVDLDTSSQFCHKFPNIFPLCLGVKLKQLSLTSSTPHSFVMYLKIIWEVPYEVLIGLILIMSQRTITNIYKVFYS